MPVVRTFILGSLVFMATAHVCLVSAAAAEPEWPGQWPCYRRDRFLTGFAPGQGRITQPEIKWRKFLGQWSTRVALQTTTADQNAELAIDDTAFSQPLPAGWTVPPTTYDLGGDGRQQRIDLQGQQATISDAAGKVLWQHTFEHPVAQYVVGQFLPGEAGSQVVFWGVKARERVVYNGGYCFDFADGFDKPQQVWEVEVDRNPQAPQLHAADMDGDGDDEVVLVTWYRAIVFDGRTGAVQMECENAAHRNYGYSRIVNVDDDPFPEIVILCDFVLHVDYIDNDGQKMWKPWEGQYEYSTARDEILRVPHDPIVDVDGDGELEMVYNLFNIPADGHWRMIVRDIKSGREELSLTDRYVHDIVDLDGDGAVELLCDQVPLRQRTLYSPIEIAQIRDGEYQTVHEFPRGRWLRYAQPLPGNSRSMAVDAALAVARGDVDGDGQLEVLLSLDEDQNRRAETLLAVGLDTDGQFAVKWKVQPPEQTRFAIEQFRDIDGDQRAEAIVQLEHRSGKMTSQGAAATLVSRRPQRGRFSFPIAVNLDNTPGAELLLQNSREEIVALSAPDAANQSPKTLWTRPGWGEPSTVGYKGSWRGPVATDLDADGQPEILYQDCSPTDLCRLVVLNADGTERWTRTFDEVPYADEDSRLDRFHAGRFNDDDVLDVFLTFHNAGKSSGQSLALDGKTGRTLWHRKYVSDLYPPGQRQLFEPKNDRGCFPTKGMVVHDFNEDGFDDLLFLALDYICLINGQTGMSLEPTPFLHSVLSDSWCAYCSPVTVDADGDGVREIFASASFGTVGALTLDWKPLWSVPSSYQTNPLSHEASVADFDGDGRLEAIVLEHSGDFVAYDVKSGEEDWRNKFEMTKISDQAAADINGDGLPEAIFCRKDTLMALSGQTAAGVQRVLWTLKLPGVGGPPIIADVDGDGFLEIVVCTSDGFVNVIGQSDESN
ncbi:FG-GAP repeat protein [Symmachiella dynata]|uniref:FG-GAP repeat protein n=1 Tax=Symmachiella dynata TaxID=2527995 RepID=A0A517ZT77_9PLAN|nr:VCBS repeat-containing protein [Symmachiella dynata]QDU45660.1 FG-GAP repeat protein [Symmachiella dynata]